MAAGWVPLGAAIAPKLCPYPVQALPLLHTTSGTGSWAWNELGRGHPMKLCCFFLSLQRSAYMPTNEEVTILPPRGWPATADNDGGMDMIPVTANLGFLHIFSENERFVPLTSAPTRMHIVIFTHHGRPPNLHRVYQEIFHM
jgi:hypothetical protein